MIKITWLYPNNRTYIQFRRVINCRADKKDYFTMNSPIYNAIEDGSMFIDLGYGKHYFKIEETNPN